MSATGRRLSASAAARMAASSSLKKATPMSGPLFDDRRLGRRGVWTLRMRQQI